MFWNNGLALAPLVYDCFINFLVEQTALQHAMAYADVFIPCLRFFGVTERCYGCDWPSVVIDVDRQMVYLIDEESMVDRRVPDDFLPEFHLSFAEFCDADWPLCYKISLNDSASVNLSADTKDWQNNFEEICSYINGR
jgi:hypothetical protein